MNKQMIKIIYKKKLKTVIIVIKYVDTSIVLNFKLKTQLNGVKHNPCMISLQFKKLMIPHNLITIIRHLIRKFNK